MKRAMFLSSAEPATYSTLSSLCSLKKPKELPFTELLELLQGHYASKPSTVVALFRLNSYRKTDSESVQEYVARLRKLYAVCAFGGMLQEMIRDRLVCGIDSEVIQGKILAETKLLLDKAVEMDVAMETAETNAQELKQSLQPKMELQSEVCRVEVPLESPSRVSGQRYKNGRPSSQDSR